MTNEPTHIVVCDICHQPILADEKVFNDGNEIAHVSCVRDWFRRNFGREGLAA